MKFKEAVVNSFYPKLDDETKQRFIYEFANLCTVAVQFNGGCVVEEEVGDEKPHNYYAMAYFMGWKWRQDILIDVAKSLGWPDPEFVEFVHDMVVRLNLVPFNPNEPLNHAQFEATMNGRCSMTKEVGTGKYAFAAQIAYEAWCKAFNREHTPHVQNQLKRVNHGTRKED